MNKSKVWWLTHTQAAWGFKEILSGCIETFFFFNQQNTKCYCLYGSVCLTSPCKQFSQAPLQARWLPGHLRCAAACWPSAAPQSCRQQTPNCPVEERVLFSGENYRITTWFYLSNFRNNLTVFLSPVQQIQADRSLWREFLRWVFRLGWLGSPKY